LASIWHQQGLLQQTYVDFVSNQGINMNAMSFWNEKIVRFIISNLTEMMIYKVDVTQVCIGQAHVTNPHVWCG